MQSKIPKSQKVFKFNTSTGEYESTLTGCGVPSIPYITVLASVATDNWNSSWTIPHGCRAFEIKRRDDADDLKIATESDGDPYFTLRAVNGQFVESLKMEELYGNEAGSTFYFQAVTSQCDVEILYWLDGMECHTPS
jgi:hypothetical protein